MRLVPIGMAVAHGKCWKTLARGLGILWELIHLA